MVPKSIIPVLRWSSSGIEIEWLKYHGSYGSYTPLDRPKRRSHGPAEKLQRFNLLRLEWD